MQTETIVFFLGNNIKFSSAVLIFGSRSMVALFITESFSIKKNQTVHFFNNAYNAHIAKFR